MHHTVRTALLSIALSCIPLLVQASPQGSISPDPTAAVLQLRSQNACATGFLLNDGRVVTNAHVARSICPFGDCQQLSVLRADAVGGQPAPVDVGAVTVQASYPALDLAILQLATPPHFPSPFTLQAPPAALGATVTTLGFPNCSALERSVGQVIDSDPLGFRTTTPVSHGSSGSPVVDDRYQVIGIVSEVTGVLPAIGSFVLGSRADARAVRAELLDAVRGAQTPLAALALQARWINGFASSVWPLSAPSRLVRSFHLFGALEGLGTSATRAEPSAARLLFSGTQSFESWSGLADVNWAAPEIQTLDQTALVRLCEEHGLRSSPSSSISLEELRHSLQQSGRPPEHVDTLIALATDCSRRGYAGAALTGLSFAAGSLAIVLLLVLLWGLSLGFLYARLRGGRRRRAALLTIAAITWPLSIIVWFVLHRGPPSEPSPPKPTNRRRG